MKRLALAILFASLGAFTQPASPATDPPPKPKTTTVELNGHVFTLPEGFTIELAAGPPLVNRPISAAFDEQGRLYVSDSSGTNDKVQVQLEQKPHRVLRLTDTKGDGKFDAATVFADKLMFPEGAMWLNGSLYVAAPPSIWKLTDTTGNGVADKREEWFKGQTLTGCANDLHGPYRGPDGWIYWCKGAFGKQTYERPGKPPFGTRAAHIFRARPDGTGIEPVMTGGMDNPVGLAFTPGGELICCGTFFQHPAGGHRDGLIHAIYGGLYGKDHDVIYDHPWTSPNLMPIMTHLGPAAPAALVRYESPAFGPEFKDNLFCALFNLHKVTRHILVPTGATFTTQDEDFLVSSNIDFHPTDVVEDADGSLLVIDTGGWYKLCCPTSQFHKPDVLGAIYRVRRKDAMKADDPRGLNYEWATATPQSLKLLLSTDSLLNGPRPAVIRRVVESLAKLGGPAVPVLTDLLGDSSAEARLFAIWAACRIDDSAARALVRSALDDRDETVRQAAIHAVSVWRDRDALEALTTTVAKSFEPERRPGDAPVGQAVARLVPRLVRCSPQNRRVAAEALGRVGTPSSVRALLVPMSDFKDRALEHSLIYALIEIGDHNSIARGLDLTHPAMRRAALTALDQMPDGKLDAAAVIKELTAADPALKETAWWIAGRHPEWGEQLSGVLRDRLAGKLSPDEQADMTRQLAKLAKSTAIQLFLAEQLANPAARPIGLHAMAQTNVRPVPDEWVSALTKLLTTAEGDQLRDAVRTTRTLTIPKPKAAALTKALLAIADKAELSAEVRLDALAAIPGGPANMSAPLFDFLRVQLRPDRSVAARTTAADVLSKSKLSKPQLLNLCEAVQAAGPLEAERLLDAFAQSTDEAVGTALVSALKASNHGGLRAAALRPRLAKFGPPVRKSAEELYAVLNADEAQQKAKLEKLLTTLADGDVRRGQSVFHSQKAACSSCHSVGYVGGKLGPDLTKIGSIRTERDLLESIVFPSASFVRSFEPIVVTTKSGKQHNGLLRKDATDEIVVATGADQEVHIPRADVDEIQPSTVSVMPAGLDQQLSPRELADLIAFLKACK
jgi:putative membrane-bound dehydrogenase-like protein